MPDVSPVLAAGGIVGMFVVCCALLLRLLSANNEVQKSQEERIERLEGQNRVCERRMNILIVACNKAGVPVPKEVWAE